MGNVTREWRHTVRPWMCANTVGPAIIQHIASRRPVARKITRLKILHQKAWGKILLVLETIGKINKLVNNKWVKLNELQFLLNDVHGNIFKVANQNSIGKSK